MPVLNSLLVQALLGVPVAVVMDAIGLIAALFGVQDFAKAHGASSYLDGLMLAALVLRCANLSPISKFE